MISGKNENAFAAVKANGKALYIAIMPKKANMNHTQHRRTRNGTSMKAM